ncbi:MAG: hypothetical protein M1813_002140 [Trichoglossum hirsutum]|nr:MAG: hypothetical protein M1813_002140 [Trichoglossum hirsutum]
MVGATPLEDSRFLNLPHDIRYRIYSQLFCSPNDLRVCDSEQVFTGESGTQWLPVQVLRTCHQVLLEAAAVLYSCNRFVVSERRYQGCAVDRILEFLQRIGDVNRGHVRTLEVDWVVGIENATDKFDVQRVVGTLDPSQGPFAETLRLATRDLVETTSSRISETIGFLNENFNNLEDLTLRLPGHNAGRLDLEHYHNLHGYFENSLTEPFSVHISFNLRRLKSMQRLSVGNTTDFDFIEREAHTIGVRHLVIFWAEDDKIREGAIEELEGRGWIFDSRERKARVTLQRINHRRLSTLPLDPGRPNFLALPPEIRQMIYHELLTSHCIQPLRPKAWGHMMLPGQRFLPGSGLLLTSRQVSREACAVLYGYNRFHLCTRSEYVDCDECPRFTNAYEFLNAIGPSNRSLIRWLIVDWAEEVMDVFNDTSDQIISALHFGHSEFKEYLIGTLRKNTSKVESSIGDALEILGHERHHFDHLSLFIPGTFALRADNRYEDRLVLFGDELIASSRVIRRNLRRIKGIKKLTLGYTVDLVALEEYAREMGVRELECCWTPTDWDSMSSPRQEKLRKFLEGGWIFAGSSCRVVKTLS